MYKYIHKPHLSPFYQQAQLEAKSLFKCIVPDSQCLTAIVGARLNPTNNTFNLTVLQVLVE